MIISIICYFLLAFSVWYIPARIKALISIHSVWPLRLASLAIVVGYISLLMTGAYTADKSISAWLYNIFGLLFIFYVCLFLYLVAAHLLSRWIKKIAGRSILAAGVAISLLYVGYGFFQALSFTATTFEIPVAWLAAPVKIAHIPDLHLGAQRGGAYLARVIETVNERRPDIIIFNGDMVDSDIALQPELFSRFSTLKGDKYFTTGNHEFYIDTERALDMIAQAGIRILRSEMIETHGLQLIGLEYMNADRVSYDSHMVNDLSIEEELPKIVRDGGKPSILIHHSPVGLQYVAKGNIDVMLSGHTHGGQLFPGTILAGSKFPLLKGLHKIDGTWFMVSQGAGTFGPWMRVGTFNEIQFITLTPAL